MSATDTHDGFWPNVAASSRPAAAIEARAQPIALEAEPIAAEPVATEPVPIALGEPAASPAIDASSADDATVDAAAVTPLEAAVVAADERAEAQAVAPATDVITDLAAELDEDQRVAMEDVIDLGDFGADPIETGVDTAQLHHLPIVESASLGGGNLDAVRAAHPRTLAAHRELEAAVMTGTDSFSEFDRTLIGLIVAIENRSGYWQVHLRRRLERWTTVEEINALAQDWTKAGLAVRERAMLAFAVKLTLVPGQMNEQDAQLLNSVGFDELDLLEIVDVIAYWGFATRVAEGLGVFVEPWMTDGEPV
jgi:uncharacterized peroxidase-related enzyme